MSDMRKIPVFSSRVVWRNDMRALQSKRALPRTTEISRTDYDSVRFQHLNTQHWTEQWMQKAPIFIFISGHP